jgi:hypothetical protein
MLMPYLLLSPSRIDILAKPEGIDISCVSYVLVAHLHFFEVRVPWMVRLIARAYERTHFFVLKIPPQLLVREDEKDSHSTGARPQRLMAHSRPVGKVLRVS